MIVRIDLIFLLGSENEIDKRVKVGKAAAGTDVRLNDNKNEMIIWTGLLSFWFDWLIEVCLWLFTFLIRKIEFICLFSSSKLCTDEYIDTVKFAGANYYFSWSAISSFLSNKLKILFECQ